MNAELHEHIAQKRKLHAGTAGRHQPLSGQLLLFPPYHMHSVHPFSGSEERAVIAFDVRLAPPPAP